MNYSKAPISDQFVIDITKRSELSDSTNLDISKPMDESSNQFFEISDQHLKNVGFKIQK